MCAKTQQLRGEIPGVATFSICVAKMPHIRRQTVTCSGLSLALLRRHKELKDKSKTSLMNYAESQSEDRQF